MQHLNEFDWAIKMMIALLEFVLSVIHDGLFVVMPLRVFWSITTHCGRMSGLPSTSWAWCQGKNHWNKVRNDSLISCLALRSVNGFWNRQIISVELYRRVLFLLQRLSTFLTKIRTDQSFQLLFAPVKKLSQDRKGRGGFKDVWMMAVPVVAFSLRQLRIGI